MLYQRRSVQSLEESIKISLCFPITDGPLLITVQLNDFSTLQWWENNTHSVETSEGKL